MILACPFCQTRFLVAAKLFENGPRTVQCARCRHSWKSEATDETVSVPQLVQAPVKSVSPPPPKPTYILPPPSKLPPRIKRALNIGISVVAFIFFILFIFNRQQIAKDWPFLEPLYDSIGLHIYHTGEGLKISNVRSELQYDSGVMNLVVDGTIDNITNKTQQIPAILAEAVGPNGDVIQSWQIEAPAATFDGRESKPFHSVINSPKGTVAQVNLNFIEFKDATE